MTEPWHAGKFSFCPRSKTGLADIDIATKSSSAFSQTWLSIEVTEQDFLSDLQNRIAAMTTNKAVEVLQLKRARGRQQSTMAKHQNETLDELSVSEVFQRRLAQEHIDDEAFKVRICQRFEQVVEEVKLEQQEAQS